MKYIGLSEIALSACVLVIQQRPKCLAFRNCTNTLMRDGTWTSPIGTTNDFAYGTLRHRMF